MHEDVGLRFCLRALLSGKKSFTGKLKLTYSELFFSTEKHAGNLKILTAAQRAEISTSLANLTNSQKIWYVQGPTHTAPRPKQITSNVGSDAP